MLGALGGSVAGRSGAPRRLRKSGRSVRKPTRRPVTASFGIAFVPDDAAAIADELILAADEALCLAKRAGKNRIGVLDDNEIGGQ